MKNKITRDLKRMGLVPNKKQRSEMRMVGVLSLIVLTLVFAVWGAFKYPEYMIQPGIDYLDYNLPAQHFSYMAGIDETPECGNDPYYSRFPWRGHTNV